MSRRGASGSLGPLRPGPPTRAGTDRCLLLREEEARAEAGCAFQPEFPELEIGVLHLANSRLRHKGAYDRLIGGQREYVLSGRQPLHVSKWNGRTPTRREGDGTSRTGSGIWWIVRASLCVARARLPVHPNRAWT